MVGRLVDDCVVFGTLSFLLLLLLLLLFLLLTSLQKFEVQMHARMVEDESPWVRCRSQLRVTLIGLLAWPSLKVVEKHSLKLPENEIKRYFSSFPSHVQFVL